MANYGLTFTVDAPYLLEEGVDINDFPILVKIPIANTSNLYGTGETADTIYFESEGEMLKHELIEISATYCTVWIKLDLEATSKKVVTLHYGALVDNNYEDKRAVWVNGASVFHFNGDCNDSMGIANGTASANVVYGTQYGMNYQGAYCPANHYFTLGTGVSISTPVTIIVFGQTMGSKSCFFGTYDSRTNQMALTSGMKFEGGLTLVVGTSERYNVATPYKYNNYLMWILSKPTNTSGWLPYIDGLTQPYIVLSDDDDAINTIRINSIGRCWFSGAPVANNGGIYLSELLIFNDAKSTYWLNAMYRMYRNPDAYIEYGTEVDLDALTDIEEIPVDCVANINKQLGIYDIDFRNIMYEVGDFNATWRLPGTEGITIWGIYQPRPVGDYFFPDMDNVGINDSLFFTVTDYLVDIHDKIDIEGVRFDLQAIQVHQIADQKIYKMCVLKRQPEYYATCKGSVS